MNEFYFSHGRTAFKYILKKIIKLNQEVLIPDYICESITQPLNQLRIKYKFYKINNDLKIDWKYLNNIIDKNTKAILFVNYFGIPNEIFRLKDFSKKNKIILIEDNSHGFYGFFEDQLMGTFGDFGFASPRKQLDINSGGILYANEFFKIDLPKFEIDLKIKNQNKIKNYIKKYPFIKNTIKKYFLKRPEYEKQISFREKEIKDYLIDDISKRKLKDIKNNIIIKKNNFENFKLIEKFAYKNKLNPIFKNYPSKINPWCYPVLLKNQKEQIKWLNWGWKNNIDIFTWPTLPKNLVYNTSNSYNLWKKIICFSTKNIENKQIVK